MGLQKMNAGLLSSSVYLTRLYVRLTFRLLNSDLYH